MFVSWINFIVLVISTILTLFYYVKSAGPAVLEQRIGAGIFGTHKDVIVARLDHFN